MKVSDCETIEHEGCLWKKDHGTVPGIYVREAQENAVQFLSVNEYWLKLRFPGEVHIKIS